jgi:ketosteroid isomerase-like protein
VSRENVELVRQLLQAFNERDLEAFVALTAPDFEWSPSVVAVDGEVFRGPEGIETYFGRMADAWAEFKTLADEMRDLGERVLVVGRLRGVGLSSGAPVEVPLSILYDVRDGRITRMHSFLDPDEALRAAGLAE